jgi:hypothetical protein
MEEDVKKIFAALKEINQWLYAHGQRLKAMDEAIQKLKASIAEHEELLSGALDSEVAP